MPGKQRLVLRESPFDVLERLQLAVTESERSRTLAGRRLYGWVKGNRFAVSVHRDTQAMPMRRNSWDPWLTGTVESTGEGTVVICRVGPSPGITLWWRVVMIFTLLTLLLPLSLAIWTDEGVPWRVWPLFALAMAGFPGALKLIEMIGMRESRSMSQELESVLREAVGGPD